MQDLPFSQSLFFLIQCRNGHPAARELTLATIKTNMVLNIPLNTYSVEEQTYEKKNDEFPGCSLADHGNGCVWCR
jgi:hypothetical protein